MGVAGTYSRRDRKDYRKNYNEGAVNEREKFVAVAAGEEYDVKIEKISTAGKGVAHIKKFMILVSSAKPGEKCKIRITKVLSKHAEAKKA